MITVTCFAHCYHTSLFPWLEFLAFAYVSSKVERNRSCRKSTASRKGKIVKVHHRANGANQREDVPPYTRWTVWSRVASCRTAVAVSGRWDTDSHNLIALWRKLVFWAKPEKKVALAGYWIGYESTWRRLFWVQWRPMSRGVGYRLDHDAKMQDQIPLYIILLFSQGPFLETNIFTGPSAVSFISCSLQNYDSPPNQPTFRRFLNASIYLVEGFGLTLSSGNLRKRSAMWSMGAANIPMGPSKYGF